MICRILFIFWDNLLISPHETKLLKRNCKHFKYNDSIVKYKLVSLAENTILTLILNLTVCGKSFKNIGKINNSKCKLYEITWTYKELMKNMNKYFN